MPTWNKFFFLCIGVIFFVLLYVLAPVLTPFLLGTLIAYLANPLVTHLTRLGLPRLGSVIIVFIALLLIFVLCILLLIPMIQAQVNNFVIVFPKMIEWVQFTVIPYLSVHLHTQELINIDAIKTTIGENWVQTGSYIGSFMNYIVKSGFLILAWLLNLILIPVVTFYLLCDWDKLVHGIKDLLPRTVAPTIIGLMRQCDQVLGAFFRGQLLVMLCIAIFYSLALSLIGLNIGLILGLIIGIISIVPYLGMIVGVVAASIAAFIQFASFKAILLVWLVFLIGQVLDSILITPQLIGDRIGLHPVVVIFAILAGGSLFGFFGVLLALPVAAVIMVWLRFLSERYHQSELYR